MDEVFKQVAKEYGLTQTQVKTMFQFQFKTAAKVIRESFDNVDQAKDIKLPLLGTFYRSLYALRSIYKNGKPERRKGAPKKVTED